MLRGVSGLWCLPRQSPISSHLESLKPAQKQAEEDLRKERKRTKKRQSARIVSGEKKKKIR